MIQRPDLHPDDHTARLAVRQQLRAIRIDEKITTYELSARLGLSRTAGQDTEGSTQWAVRRIQAWARALGHCFTMTVTGVRVPQEYDLHTELLRVVSTFGAADEDRLHLLEVVNDLIRVREDLGITYRDMGARMGVTERAVPYLEEHPSKAQVRSVQRYARALGGALVLDVAPVAAVVPA